MKRRKNNNGQDYKIMSEFLLDPVKTFLREQKDRT
jgi:hypothetical protein